MIKAFAKSSSVYFLGMLVNRGLAFFLVPIYTYYLQPKDYGILAVCFATTTILGQLLLLSLDAAIIRFKYILDDSDYRGLLTATWISATIFPLIILLTIQQIGNIYGNLLFTSVPWNPYLSLSLWIAYFTIVQTIVIGLFRAKERAFSYSIFNFSLAITTASFAVFFVGYLKLGVVGILYGQLISVIIFAIVSHVIIIQNILPWVRIGWNHLKEALLLYIPLLPHGIAIMMLNLSDRWILERYVSLNDLGLYNLAFSFGMIIFSLGQAQALSFTPMLFKDYHNEQFKQGLSQMLLIFALIPIFIGFTISFFSEEILKIMTRPPYYPAAHLVPIFILAYLFYVVIYMPHLAVVEYYKKTKWIPYISVPVVVINILLNIVVVPRYGIYGAAVNLVLGFGGMAVLAVFLSRRLDSEFPFPWLKVGGITLLLISIQVIYNLFFSFSIWVAIILKSFLTILCILLVLKIIGLNLAKIKSLFVRK